jgi:MFS family permease
MLLTHLLRNVKAITSMAFGMFVMPISAMAMSLGPWLGSQVGNEISILGIFNMHPISLMLVVGIIFQAIAESLISPRYLEFFSLQAPAGEEGMYLGFSNLHMFFAAISGFFISGLLLDKYCPDPKKLQKLYEAGKISLHQMNHAYDNAHHLWYIFAFIGMFAAFALLLYGQITEKIDKKKRQKENKIN